MSIISNVKLIPLFWDELEQFLGPFFQPIVGPLFDYLRVDANRLFLLSTVMTLCFFAVVIAYTAYELPVIFRWLAAGSESLNAAQSRPTTKRAAPMTSTRYSTKAKSAQQEEKKKISSAEAIGDVHVTSVVEKKHEEVLLTVNVENKSEHQIEMVVVDLTLPPGIDIMTGSFRMQRIGTVQPGNSSAAHFRLRHNYGSLSELSGQVEFMSSSYEITKVDIPSPQID